MPVNSVSELINYARANQASINMASAGVGSQSHLAGALLMTMANFDSGKVMKAAQCNRRERKRVGRTLTQFF